MKLNWKAKSLLWLVIFLSTNVERIPDRIVKVMARQNMID